MDRTVTERRLLGLMLVDSTNISLAIRAGITATCYQQPCHAEIHNAIIDTAIDTGGQVDAVCLAEHLSKKDRFGAVGGADFIVTILETVRLTDRVTDLAPLVQNRVRNTRPSD